MTKNKLSDLNDHLFMQLERLNDDTLTGEQLQNEIEKAKAITNVGKEIINIGSLTLKALEVVANGLVEVKKIPGMLKE